MWGYFEINYILHKILDPSVEKEKEKTLNKGTFL